MSTSIWTVDDAGTLQGPPAAPQGRTTSDLLVMAGRAGLALAAVLFVVRVVRLDTDLGGVAATVVVHAWTLLLLAGAGLLLRSMPLRRILAMASIGFFVVAPLVAVLVDATRLVLPSSGDLQVAGVVPVVEEVCKFLPLLVLARAGARDQLRTPTAFDLLLAGLAVGAGFAVHEDALWDRVLVSGVEFGGIGSWLFPFVVRFPVFVVGHAGWTALAGAGLGLWLVHGQRSRLWLAAPVAGLGLAVLDHAAVNVDGGLVLQLATGGGVLAYRALFLAVLAVVASGLWVRRWALARDGVFGDVPWLRQGAHPPARWRYLRQRNGAWTLAYRRLAPGGERAAHPWAVLVLAAQARAAGAAVDPAAATAPPRPPAPVRRQDPAARTRVGLVLAGLVLLLVVTAVGLEPQQLAAGR